MTKTEKSHITVIYNRVKNSHVTRGLPEITYNKSVLTKWLYDNGYKRLFRKWSRSGFAKVSAPSLDRLDTTKGYSLDNLELVTWYENQRRAYLDRKNGVGRMASENEAVTQLTMTDEYVNSFVSVSEASRETGINRGNISSTAEGKLKSAGGYKWMKSKEYDVSMESDTDLW